MPVNTYSYRKISRRNRGTDNQSTQVPRSEAESVCKYPGYCTTGVQSKVLNLVARAGVGLESLEGLKLCPFAPSNGPSLVDSPQVVGGGTESSLGMIQHQLHQCKKMM